MKLLNRLHNHVVAALLSIFLGTGYLMAQTPELDALFDQLATADERAAQRIEKDIWLEWSRSGSATRDLLLQRGRDAMAAGDLPAAVAHLTALTDHAPDFAEGWNARATAYFQSGDYGPSIADIGRVLTLNPRHFGAMAGLGAMLEELNRPEEALKVYREALTIHPHLTGVRKAAERLETVAAGQEL